MLTFCLFVFIERLPARALGHVEFGSAIRGVALLTLLYPVQPAPLQALQDDLCRAYALYKDSAGSMQPGGTTHRQTFCTTTEGSIQQNGASLRQSSAGFHLQRLIGTLCPLWAVQSLFKGISLGMRWVEVCQTFAYDI